MGPGMFDGLAEAIVVMFVLSAIAVAMMLVGAGVGIWYLAHHLAWL